MLPLRFPGGYMINSGNIPQELKDLNQWVCWKWDTKPNGDKTKVPVNWRTLANASSTNPKDWGNYEACLNAWRNSKAIAGVGFVFTEDDPYVGVDFDDCIVQPINPMSMNPEIRATEEAQLEMLNSYAEVSPSGTGFKVIFKGDVPEEYAHRHGFGKGNGIYSSGRFFTITGNVIPGYETIQPPLNLRSFLYSVFPQQERGNVEWEATEERLTDNEVLTLATNAANAEKFTMLWRGDWESVGEYDSQSNADMALVKLLAFYVGPVPNQIDRLFRQSGLFRDKWDEQRGPVTYGMRTIEYALDNTDEYYTTGVRAMNGFSGSTNVVRYGPVVEKAAEGMAQEEWVDYPQPTRKDTVKSWQKLMVGYEPLAVNEMPYWLHRIHEHIAPLGRCFTTDWLEMSILGFWSSLWGGKRFENLPLNLWTLGISKQGTGKSVVADELDELAHRVNHLLGNPALLRYTSGSAAGLIRRLEGRNRSALAYFSEWSGFAKGMDAEHSSSMREVLMNLYDGRNFFHQLASETVSGENPYLVINAITTPVSWANTADPTDAGNGLYSRFLMFMPNTRKLGFVHRETHEREALAQAIYAAAEGMPVFQRCQFQAGTDGPNAYRTYYRDVLKLEGDEGEEEDMDDALLESDEEKMPTGRQAARVKKVAALLELMEERPQVKHDTLFVRDTNVEKAIRVVQRGAGYAVRSFGLVSRSQDEMDAARVRRAIEKMPNISLMGILRMTGLNQGAVKRSIEMLSEEGLIQGAIAGGRRVYTVGG